MEGVHLCVYKFLLNCVLDLRCLVLWSLMDGIGLDGCRDVAGESEERRVLQKERDAE